MKENTHNRRTRSKVRTAAVAGFLGLAALTPVIASPLSHTAKHAHEQIVPVDAETYARSMQDALNHGETFTGVTIRIHDEFDVNVELKSKLGIDKIYAPIIMTEGKYAYANVDQNTGEVSIHLVDAHDGVMVGGNNPTGKFTPIVDGIKVQTVAGSEGFVLATADPLQSFVGQAVPYTENS